MLCEKCQTEFTPSKLKKKKYPNRCRSCCYVKHNETGSKLYWKWSSQRSRCENINDPNYTNYGNRGIKFDKAFKEFKDWKKYILSLPNAEKNGYTLDRIDNNKNYAPGNIKWSTLFEQQNNQRPNKNNTSGYMYVTYDKRRKKYYGQFQYKHKKYATKNYETALEAHIAINYVIANNKLNKKISKEI